jgi:hypothetical protein
MVCLSLKPRGKLLIFEPTSLSKWLDVWQTYTIETHRFAAMQLWLLIMDCGFV